MSTAAPSRSLRTARRGALARAVEGGPRTPDPGVVAQARAFRPDAAGTPGAGWR